MANYIEKLKKIVEQKTGKNFDSIKFKELSSDKESYVTDLVRGSVNLIERRFIIKKDVDEMVEKLLKIEFQ
ncbi:MAG: hypothetical protein LBT48_07215 [Prevotellaceae bacterium]|jgi:hypothetical protein|nr:hypothetical protein [Prevotellaceae bacterium]